MTMKGEPWQGVYRKLESLASGRRRKRQQFSDQMIVRVYLWAVWHERPINWACHEENWAGYEPRGRLPSPSTMSRRLDTAECRALLKEVEEGYKEAYGPSLFKCIDALPLPIGNSSGDRQAGYGRSAAGMGKGYKVFAIYQPPGLVVTWRLGPMNQSERTMGCRLIRDVSGPGYLVGDGEYDTNPLYEWAQSRGLILLAPKREGQALGHRWQSVYRRRGIELQQRPFGQELLKARGSIDRFFGRWASWAAGLKHPPAWVRGHKRMERWVRAKIILLYAWQEKRGLTA
jgi:hypothetical protein